MNNFQIDVAAYNGSSGDSNPAIWVHGFVNGISSGYWNVSWDTIQQANTVGGVAAVQAVLGPILLGVYGPPFPRGPVFSAGVVPPPPANSNGQSIPVPEALVPNWSA